MLLEKILGYGKIGKSKVMTDGSIRFCARIARANRDYKYRNRDGSIRTERITTAELFKAQSLDTLKLLPVVHPHAPEAVAPENYHKYAAGSTGDVPIQDGEFLVVTGHLRRKDAIDAFNSGVRELSPGYYRELSALQSDGAYYQLDRRYLELALVPYARGGRELRIDANLDTSQHWQFDLDNPIADWDDTARDDGLFDRLLDSGQLNPPPVNLPLITMPKITIGQATIEVAADSIDAAVSIKSSYDKLAAAADSATELKAKLDATQKANADAAIELKAKLDAAESANAELTKKLSDSADIKTKVASTIQAVQAAVKTVAIFDAKGIDTKEAKLALDNCDIDGYKKAIVQKIAPDTNADAVETYYNAYVAAMSKDMALTQEPNGVPPGANYPSIGSFSMPNGINTTTGTNGVLAYYLNGGERQMVQGQNNNESSALPPDDSTHGWM